MLLSSFLLAQMNNTEPLVKITNKVSSIETKESGQIIKIMRVQDTNNKLNDDFTKTSRPCPPFCIQLTKIHDKIKNIAELEVLDFIQNKLSNKNTLLVDTRLKNWFDIETIPSAINIPYTVIENHSQKSIKKLFQLLGMNIESTNQWDFKNVKNLIIFDNGVWCEQAQHFVNALIKYNYPKDKIFYYRAGLQGWKLLGLTTIIHKEIKDK